MNVWKNTLLASGLALATFALPALGQTTNIVVNVVAESSIVVTTPSVTLSKVDTIFGNFTGTSSIQYKLRTTKGTGSGSITAMFTTEFNGNGPKVATDLRYTSVSTLGTPFTNMTPSTTAGTNVITFGANARSAKAGTTDTVNWTLTDDPQFETDPYTATVTYTISAS